MMDCTTAQELRHLYLDGELDPAEAPAIDAHLDCCPACRPVFARDRALSAALKLEGRRHRAPEALRVRIRSEIARLAASERRAKPAFRGGWNPAAIAASLMLAVVASSALTSVYWRGVDEGALAQEVVASHIRSLMADHLTDVPSSNQHVIKPWFKGKIDIAPPVVDLAASGYPLVGGRLDYIDGHSVAALVYERQQHVINVLVMPEKASHRAAAESTRQGYTVIRLARAGMVFWVISDLNSGELRDFVARLGEAMPEQNGGS